jgi:two-component system chemotaxis sensor kinase CheA
MVCFRSGGEMTTMDDDAEFMATLRRTFADEAAEFVDACEEAVLSLADVERREQTLADIFRAYHSVKGSASAIGCSDLAAFAHVAEDCLSEYRKSPAKITDAAIGVLLEANDAIRARIGTVCELPLGDEHWAAGKAKVEAALARLIAEATGAAVGLDAVSPAPSPGAAPGLPAAAAPAPRGTAPAKAQALAIKIDATRVDAVMDMVGELVVIKSQITEGLAKVLIDARLRTLVAQLDKSVRELHERTLAMRMVSLKAMFIKLERTVKDVADKLGKRVAFEVDGEDTEIDRAMVERIADPLMHLCRNAVDHGIEAAEARQAAGKSATGSVKLRAFRKGEAVVIEIEDDGRGVDRGKVVAKAVTKGLLPAGADSARIGEKEVFDLLFLPGFSTAERVTDVSGRGVGLDVVGSNIAAVGGSIEVESVCTRGSTFRLCLPLTTAITDGIVVSVGDKPYILPLDAVTGFFERAAAELVGVDGSGMLARLKGAHYPFVRLGDIVGVEPRGPGLVILIEAQGKRIALLVDRVDGKTQVVLKPIGLTGSATEGLGGAAVMGNGRVALIIDVMGLAAIAERAARQPSPSLEVAA